jgi:anthranilate synthase component I
MYRAVRHVMPAAQGFYLKIGPLDLLGTTQESLAFARKGKVTLQHIDRSQSRPVDPAADRDAFARFCAENSPDGEGPLLREQLKRNLEQVAQTSSIKIEDYELRTSRRSFLRSAGLHGTLKEGLSPIDVIAATLPHPRLSGMPRPEALQFIESHEHESRGVFGGAVGYIGLDNSMHMVTTQATVIIHQGRTHIQLGLPVSADTAEELLFEQGAEKANELYTALHSAMLGLDGRK